MYANVRRKDRREQNVSLCDLAPCPSGERLDSATVPDPDVLVDAIPDESDTSNLKAQCFGFAACIELK